MVRKKIWALILAAIFAAPLVSAQDLIHIVGADFEGEMFGEAIISGEGGAIPPTVIPISALTVDYHYKQKIVCPPGEDDSITRITVAGDIIGKGTDINLRNQMEFEYLGLIWLGTFERPLHPTEMPLQTYNLGMNFQGQAVTTLGNLPVIREQIDNLNFQEPLDELQKLGHDLVTLHLYWEGAGPMAGSAYKVDLNQCD